MWKIKIEDLYEQDNYENILESFIEAKNWIDFKLEVPVELTDITGPMEDKKYIGSNVRYKVEVLEIGDVPDNLGDIQIILTKTDWLFIADVIMEKEYRIEFKKYREYLRKLPRTTKIEDFSDWLRRTRPDYFMEGRQGPDMIKKFKTYL